MSAEVVLFNGLRCLRWLGRPYTSTKPLSWFQIVVTVTIAFSIDFVSLFVSIHQFVYKKDTVSTLVFFFVILGNNFLASYLLLLNLRSSHPLLEILKDLEDTSVPKSRLKHFIWYLVSFGFLSANIILDFTSSSFVSLLERLPFYLSDVLTLSFLVQIITPLKLIEDRLLELCVDLEALESKESPSIVAKTLELVHSHKCLLQVCSTINLIYSCPLLLITSCSLIASVGSVYYAVCSLLKLLPNVEALNGSEPAIVQVLGFIVAAATDLYKIWCIMHTAEKTSKYIAKFKWLLYNLVLQDDSNALVENEQIVTYLERKAKFKFTACGFFSLGHSFFTSVLASTSIYIFIVVQFQIQSNSHC